MIAPAPAQTPSIAATIGCGQARIALTRSPVMRVNISRSGHAHLRQRADDLVHVAARAEVVAGALDDDRAHVAGLRQRAERDRASSAYGVERQRVLALGAVERDDADVGRERPADVTRGKPASRARLPGARSGSIGRVMRRSPRRRLAPSRRAPVDRRRDAASGCASSAYIWLCCLASQPAKSSTTHCS